MKFDKTVIAICTWITLCVPAVMNAQVNRIWTLSEHQLNIPNGGRTNTIALNPINSDRRYVASESGGLFKTENGLTWTHIDDLKVTSTECVVYNPRNSNFVFATAKADFKAVNGGGLWVGNSNSGTDWHQMNLNAPGSGERLSGYEIAMQRATGKVFVGTSEGVFKGSDNEPWTYFNAFDFQGGDKRVFSVLATDTAVYFGGPSGVSVQVTATDVITTTNLGPITEMHAFGASPISGSAVFAVSTAGYLFVTRDNGTNWQWIPSAPVAAGGCKGIPFIKVGARTSGTEIIAYDLYYSNGCVLYMGVGTNVGSFDVLVNSWSPADVDHRDPRDLALVERTPILLASNGGLHKTTDGGHTWRLAGGGPYGYNALQVYEIKGQRIRRTPLLSHFDRYIGTQDNNLWAIDGLDASHLTSFPWGGHHIETDGVVPPKVSPNITFAACPFSCRNELTGRLFTDQHGWPNAPNHRGSPVDVQDCQYVQNFRERLTTGISVTEQCGADWQTFVTYRQETRDVPKVARSGFGDPSQTTILYQAYKTNAFGPEWALSAGHLLRATRPLFSSDPGEVTYPAMNGFGVLGFGPTMIPVFATDPVNPDHVIAADVFSGVMSQTDPNGLWSPIPSLTNAVSNGGRLQFKSALDRPQLGRIFSLVSAVSFSPQDPTVVLAGTVEGGIYVSNNSGADWAKIDGTDRATNVTSFTWENANRVYVSTFGRGLWRLDNRTIEGPASFNQLCGGTCEIVTPDGKADKVPFDNSVMVFDGAVLGVRTQDKLVREVFVTPGSSVIFTADEKDTQDDIAITESDGSEKDAYEPLPKGPDGWIAKGIVMMSDDTQTGTVFGDAIATLVPPAGKDTYSGSTKSPTSGTPYVTVMSSDFDGFAATAPGEAFQLEGTDFTAGVSYEFLVDGQLVKGSTTADGAGSFEATITAPSEPGYHRVDVRAAGSETILDASMFVVRYDR